MKIYSFEKLNCWIKAKEITIWTYKMTMNLPDAEKFGLVSQMRRAAVSIASNIAEGTSRKSKKDQSRFTVVAYSSTIELLNDLILLYEMNFIKYELYEQGRKLIEELTNLLSGLHKSQQVNKP